MRKFCVWTVENGPEDGVVVMASDAEHAACLWAERDDWSSAEYRIANGAERTVMVRPIDAPDEVTELTVRGECVPSYFARAAGGEG